MLLLLVVCLYPSDYSDSGGRMWMIFYLSYFVPGAIYKPETPNSETQEFYFVLGFVFRFRFSFSYVVLERPGPSLVRQVSDPAIMLI